MSTQSIEMLDVSNISGVDQAVQSAYTINCLRFGSNENLGGDIRRMLSAEDCVQHLLMSRQFSNVSMEEHSAAPAIDPLLRDDSIEEGDEESDYTEGEDLLSISPVVPGTSEDDSECPSTAVPNTPTSGSFEELHNSRPWENEESTELNTVPSGFCLPDPVDNSLALGDMRVIGRFHVQRVANEKGLKLPAGMTNSELIDLAASLGLYPLIYRLHLEASEQIQMRQSHALYMEYKKESKVRAKTLKAGKDVQLISHMRILPEGKMTIDYYEGVALRLGRERDTIFRPLLHKVFREFKEAIKESLRNEGLIYSEMRKWRDPQLCTALHVCNSFVPGIWQAAVDVHLSKTKDFI